MRSEALPGIPTVGEFVPGYEATAWFGLGAPKNTPAEIVDILNREVNAGLADPKIKQRLADLGGVPMPMSPAEFSKLMPKARLTFRNAANAGGATLLARADEVIE
jgi:tripartite-type tricarboxylate transporter receptor subunit TctC